MKAIYQEKDKIEYKNNASFYSIKKASGIKKTALMFGLLFTALSSWDVAVHLTNVKKVSDMINYKINNDRKINNYSDFKSQMEAIPYSDSDFKRDLNIFKAIDINGTDAFKKAIGYDDSLDALLLLKYRYEDPVAYLEAMSFSNKESSDNDEKIQNVSDKFEIKSSSVSHSSNIKELELSKSYRVVLNSENNILNNNIYAPLYGNFEKLLEEHGINKNMYFWMSAYSELKQGKIKSNQYEVEQEKINKNNAYKIEVLREYYKNGDLKKLREVFKLGNSFTKVAIEQSIKKNADINIPFSAALMMYINSDYNYDNTLVGNAKTYQSLIGDSSSKTELEYDKIKNNLWF